MRTALAVLVLVLGSRLPAGAAEGPTATQGQAPRQVRVRITAMGFEPSRIEVKQGVPTTLVFERVTDHTCIKAIDIPDENVTGLELPLGKPVSVTITPRRVGVEKFHCSAMGMGNGRIVVEK